MTGEVKPSPRNGAADQTDGARFVTDGRMVERSVPRMPTTPLRVSVPAGQVQGEAAAGEHGHGDEGFG